MRSKTGPEISHNVRIKRFPDGSMEVMAAERPIFREAGWEAREGSPRAPRDRQERVENECSDMRAIRRARAKVRDIAMANQMPFFVTLTLDQARVDRYDMDAVMRKVNRLLDNQVRRHGLRYVLVPELHKDGAIHFHGFVDWLPKDWSHLVDSGTMQKPGQKRPQRPRSDAQRREWMEEGYRIVWNVKSWSLGFSTAIKVYGEYAAAVNYCVKYVGKDMAQGKIGGRWYYSGGRLAKPEVSYADLELEEVAALPGAFSFTVPEARLGMAVWRGKEGV